MIATERGQDISFMCWAPVQSHGWLTACTPLDTHHASFDMFEWVVSVREDLSTPSGDEEEADDELRAWVKGARRSVARWARENPY